jgi:hypothetical protein
MGKKVIRFGKAIIPVTKKHKQTGAYTSFSSKEIMHDVQIRFYPPTFGDPLYEESPSKHSEPKV